MLRSGSLLAPLLLAGCGVLAQPDGPAAQVSQDFDQPPQVVCTAPAVTGGALAAASSMTCVSTPNPTAVY